MTTVLVGILLLGGGGVGAYFLLQDDGAKKDAASAWLKFQEDAGPNGRLVAADVTATMKIKSGGMDMEIGMAMSMQAHAADAVSFRAEITRLVVNGQRQTMLDGATVLMTCSSERITVKTTGLEDFGGDADLETRNDERSCAESKNEASMARLREAAPPFAKSMLSSMQTPGGKETRKVVDAERDGSTLKATYKVETPGGRDVNVTSVIRDGRIVSEVGESAEGLNMEIRYRYGERSPIDQPRGAKTV